MLDQDPNQINQTASISMIQVTPSKCLNHKAPIIKMGHAIHGKVTGGKGNRSGVKVTEMIPEEMHAWKRPVKEMVLLEFAACLIWNLCVWLKHHLFAQFCDVKTETNMLQLSILGMGDAVISSSKILAIIEQNQNAIKTSVFFIKITSKQKIVHQNPYGVF